MHRTFAPRDAGESSREWRWRVGTLRPDALCADHSGRREQQQGRRCQKTRRGAPWSRLQSQVGGRWHDVGDFAGGALGGDCAYDSKKRPSGAENWPYGLTLDSVADMNTSLSALSSTVISTFLSRVASQLEVIALRHQLGSSGARSLPTLACTSLAPRDLAAGRQRETQHDTFHRLWPSPFGPTR